MMLNDISNNIALYIDKEEEKNTISITTGTLIDGDTFNKRIPETATSVVFTDQQKPEEVNVEDFSVENDSSIIAWLDQSTKTFYVSSCEKDKLIKANTNCSDMFSCHDSTTGIVNKYGEVEYVPQLKSIDFKNLNTEQTTDMNGMFSSAIFLQNINFGDYFKTSNVTQFHFMFFDCRCLTQLDLSAFDTHSAASMDSMFLMNQFTNQSLLQKIYVTDKFIIKNSTSGTDMFEGCISLVGGNGTTYNSSNTSKEYAHIDGGISNPGYFTDIKDK